MTAPAVAAIVLAAGQSTRLGHPKQLLPFSGRPLLERVLDIVRASRLAPRVLVLGSDAAEIAARIDAHGFEVVVNAAFASGQSSSLHAGLAALPPDVDSAVVLLGDQPLVPAWLLGALAEHFDPTRHVAVRPRYADRPGNPILLGRALFDELRALEGDVGARDVLRRHPDAVLDFDVPELSAPGDVDTQADYEALLRDWSSTGAPDMPRYCQRCAAPVAVKHWRGALRPVCPACGFTYFFDPKLAVAIVVEIGDRIVLQRRTIAPGVGQWTYPGGFVDRGEPLEVAAAREVFEEVGLRVDALTPLSIYSEPGETVVLAAFCGRADGQTPIVGHESSAVGLFDPDDAPPFAFSRDALILRDWRQTGQRRETHAGTEGEA